jgi:hypothetical protein
LQQQARNNKYSAFPENYHKIPLPLPTREMGPEISSSNYYYFIRKFKK